MSDVNIDKILNNIGDNISSMINDVYMQMIRMILVDKLSPQEAQKQIKKALSVVNENSAELIAMSLSSALQKSFSVKYVKNLSVQGVTLSQRLYNNSKGVALKTQHIINNALKENKTVEEIAKLLYDGYDFKLDTLDIKKRKNLPKWLKAELEKAPSKRSFYQVKKIKTPALKTAYTEALKAKSFSILEIALISVFH